MSDQHNAGCVGYRNHPNVRTPNLDALAADGVDFLSAFSNNPICAPSRICFMTGQYVHTHGFVGNWNRDWPDPNPDSMGSVFRMHGYQTALIGKSHMVRRWDADGFEYVQYTDLCDADPRDPLGHHYFSYLHERGLADLYEEGTPKPGQQTTMDGSAPAKLPYEHSIEAFTGERTLDFLQGRDPDRPFFIHMSFQRPHAPIAPAREHFDMYNPEEMVLPESAYDYFENRFHGKPRFMVERLKDGCGYPLADPDPGRLKRCLASYYALITAIDSEIGRVLDALKTSGEYENTVIVYTADHGDFAGEHGLFHKNFGIYDSIHRIPFLIKPPATLREPTAGTTVPGIVESVDLYPTLCDLCGVPMPAGREGMSLVPLLRHGCGGVEQGDTVQSSAESIARIPAEGKPEAFCEWDWAMGRISAVRTRDFRLVFYGALDEGELYDHRTDPDETKNLWHDPGYRDIRLDLVERLLQFTLAYRTLSNASTDREKHQSERYTAGEQLQKHRKYWSDLDQAYTQVREWPPEP